MSDHQFDPAPLDLELVAQLIDESSLGSVEALEAQNDVPADEAMRLRDRVRQDAPDRRWDSLPGSTAVLTYVARVMPEFDGCFTAREQLPVDHRIFAVNRDRKCRELEPPAFRLPGSAHREQWDIYIASDQEAYRCTVLWTTTLRQWMVEAAIWWQLVDPARAASTGFTTIGPDLIGKTAEQLGYTETDAPDSVGKQILFEGALVQEMQRAGIAAECAIRVLWHDEVGSSSSTPQRPTSPPADSHPVKAIAARRTESYYSSSLPSSPPPAPAPRWGTRIPSQWESSTQLVMYLAYTMKVVHREKRTRPSPEYQQLVDQRLANHSRAVEAVESVAYVLELLTEALRIAGIQIDDARGAVVDLACRTPPTVLLTIGEVASRTAECDFLPDSVVAFLAKCVVHDSMDVGHPPSSPYALEAGFPDSRRHSGLIMGYMDPTLVEDIEARRKERYAYGDLFA